MKLSSLLLLALTPFIWSACSKPETASNSTLTFARGSDAQKLDPADVSDGESADTLTQMCEGLLRFKAGTLELEPCLAESYSMSEDGLSMVFQIRPGVVFHDGTPLTAETAAFSFRRQMDKEHPAHFPGASFEYWHYLYQDIVAVEVTGEMELTFRLSQPNSTLLRSFAIFPAYLLSPKSFEEYGEEMVNHPVGTGPYQFVSWQRGQAVVMKRFDRYWGEPAGFDRLVMKVVPDNAVRLLELKSGSIDALNGLQPAEVKSLMEDPAFKVYHGAGMNFGYLSFNENAERLRDPDVREAIFMAINRQRIVDTAFDGMAEIAHFPLAKGMLGEPKAFEPVPYDPEAAKAVLAEYADRWEEPIVISVMNAPRLYAPDPTRIVSLIRSDLEAVGLKVDIQVRDFMNHLNYTREGQHEMAFLGWMGDNGDPDNFLSIHLASWAAVKGAATNISFYKNEAVDELLKAGRLTADMQERQQLYEQVLQHWREDLPYLPLVHGENIVVMSSEVEGFILNADSDIHLGSVKRKAE